ncbi:MAG: hypothetical protein QW589_02070 [Candidatus Bathyarchaeia archaeon]
MGQSHRVLTKMISQITNQIIDAFKEYNLSLSEKRRKKQYLLIIKE